MIVYLVGQRQSQDGRVGHHPANHNRRALAQVSAFWLRWRRAPHRLPRRHSSSSCAKRPFLRSMKFKKEEGSNGEDRSVRLQIIPQQSGGGGGALTSGDSRHHRGSFFEPQPEPSEATPSSYIAEVPTVDAPEKKITLFALRLAVLEKTASGIGTLGFIWATVVLLGGFAVILEKMDFWFVTAILVVQGTRIFSRSHELEWQHQATWSMSGGKRYSFNNVISSSRAIIRSVKAVFLPLSAVRSDGHTSRRIADDLRQIAKTSANSSPLTAAARRWRTSEIPVLPYIRWIFLSKNISRALNWLQILAAVACMTLSLTRLIDQNYGESDSSDSKNKPAALNIFYTLAVAESITFLLEKAYWEWKVNVGKIIHQVNCECEFGPCGVVLIKRFFYDAYSSCINGSVFDGVKMDLVSFAEELLGSKSHDEQLMGVRILQKFSTVHRFSGETLRKIGTSNETMERLIEMLNWKNVAEEEIRRSAAEILAKLAGKRQNALRVAGIPGAIESVSSLLYTGRKSVDTKPFEVWGRSVVADRPHYEYTVFNLLGLQILKRLANDHDNCGKIGNTRGLLSKIIDFTSDGKRILRNDQVTESQKKTMKRSLQIVRLLASATGQTGKVLRREISDIFSTVSNIREILEDGNNQMTLQKLSIEILSSLSMDESAREEIGSTGGVVRLLVSIFCKPRLTEYQDRVSVEAGEALAMLTLESQSNCDRLLKQPSAVEKLIDALEDPVLRINSSRILRNLCAYSAVDASLLIREAAAAAAVLPMLLRSIMLEDWKLLEASVGLAVQLLKLISADELDEELRTAQITDEAFSDRLVRILEKHGEPRIKVPRIRRFVIDTVIGLMKLNGGYAEWFEKAGMEEALRGVEETTSDLECFSIFSGSVGINRQSTSILNLVDAARELMRQRRRA